MGSGVLDTFYGVGTPTVSVGTYCGACGRVCVVYSGVEQREEAWQIPYKDQHSIFLGQQNREGQKGSKQARPGAGNK